MWRDRLKSLSLHFLFHGGAKIEIDTVHSKGTLCSYKEDRGVGNRGAVPTLFPENQKRKVRVGCLAGAAGRPSRASMVRSGEHAKGVK